MYESLHNHTTTSDGVEDYVGVLKTAEQYKVCTVAFTDHDALPDVAAIEQLRAYTGPVSWSVGIEISSGYATDHSASGSLHIVGQFVDVHDVALREHCKLAQEARQERMTRMVQNLNKQGFAITEAACHLASGGESVGRPHVVSALLADTANEQRLRDLVKDMERDTAAAERYAAMQARAKVRGVSEYIYSLLLADDPYIKGVYVDYLYVIDMDRSVALIRNAGGVALQAHWWTYEKKLSLETLRSYLIDGRIDGIEVIGGANQYSEAAYPTLLQLAKDTDCLVSVGADAHKPADFERYVAMSCVGNTVGVFDTLVDRAQPKQACWYRAE